MQEAFEKIIQILKEQKSGLTEWSEDKAFEIGIEKAIEIIKQVAAEYSNECNHKWVFQEKQLKTELSGYENYTAHYHRTDIYFCEKCCEIKNVEKKESVRLPSCGIHHLKNYAPIWYQPKGE